MKLEHVAIWTRRLEELKDFYVLRLGGMANDKYTNRATGMESYFITFAGGARLEIMTRPDVTEQTGWHPEPLPEPRAGITHIAFDAGSCGEVDRMAHEFQENGITVLRGPRTTGDGYYEFEALDPDGNRIEITARPFTKQD